jgi:hypothetical protein
VTKLLNFYSQFYGWFTEGFDTRDLKEAKALLDELHVTAGPLARQKKGPPERRA